LAQVSNHATSASVPYILSIEHHLHIDILGILEAPCTRATLGSSSEGPLLTAQ